MNIKTICSVLLLLTNLLENTHEQCFCDHGSTFLQHISRSKVAGSISIWKYKTSCQFLSTVKEYVSLPNSTY